MNVADRRCSALLVLTLAGLGLGCNEGTTTSPTSINQTPSQVLNPTAPGETPDAGTKAASTAKADPDRPAAEPKAEPEKPAAEPEKPAAKSDAEPARADDQDKAAADKPAACAEPLATAELEAEAAEVTLVPVKFDEMKARIAANKAKYTMVDAWATWCGPCKENFPHVVEMHKTYGSQGLAVVSLSLDDPTNAKAVAEARKFLKEKNAVFTNFLLDEEQDAAFEKLDITAIPAVFIFGPDGKEVKRFTLDDPNKQFTYDQVEQAVAALLRGQPTAKD